MKIDSYFFFLSFLWKNIAALHHIDGFWGSIQKLKIEIRVEFQSLVLDNRMLNNILFILMLEQENLPLILFF